MWRYVRYDKFVLLKCNIRARIKEMFNTLMVKIKLQQEKKDKRNHL